MNFSFQEDCTIFIFWLNNINHIFKLETREDFVLQNGQFYEFIKFYFYDPNQNKFKTEKVLRRGSSSWHILKSSFYFISGYWCFWYSLRSSKSTKENMCIFFKYNNTDVKTFIYIIFFEDANEKLLWYDNRFIYV